MFLFLKCSSLFRVSGLGYLVWGNGVQTRGQDQSKHPAPLSTGSEALGSRKGRRVAIRGLSEAPLKWHRVGIGDLPF